METLLWEQVSVKEKAACWGARAWTALRLLSDCSRRRLGPFSGPPAVPPEAASPGGRFRGEGGRLAARAEPRLQRLVPDALQEAHDGHPRGAPRLERPRGPRQLARPLSLCFGRGREDVLGHQGQVVGAQRCQALHTLVKGRQKLAVPRRQDVGPHRRSLANFFYEGPVRRRHVIPHPV